MEYISNKDESSDAVEALANGIAHDVNNLLAAIKGHASLMMSSVNPSDPLYGHITEILSCIDKGSEIANQLLGFAQADAFYRTRIDVNRLVRGPWSTWISRAGGSFWMWNWIPSPW